MEENRNREFVAMYRQRLDELSDSIPNSQRHLEQALCHLLNRFADEIPPVQCDRFHKTFRQSDVIDPDAPDCAGGALDMVFWNLLACDCKVFWKLQQKFCEQLETESPDQES